MAKVKIQGHASGTGVFTITAPNSNTDRTITLPDASVTLGTDATKLPLAGGTMTGSLKHGDNVHTKFGTGDDLDIYHDGSDSIIKDVGTGNLLLMSDGAGVYIQKGSSETIAQFKTDGACNLYYDNAKKIETTATGVAVTGKITGAVGSVLQVVENTAHSVVASDPSSYTTLYSAAITPSSSSNKILVTAVVGGLYLNYGGNQNNTNWRIARGSTTPTGSNTSFQTEVGRSATGTGERAYITMHILDEPNTTSATTYSVQLIRINGSGGISIGDTAGTSSITLMEIGA